MPAAAVSVSPQRMADAIRVLTMDAVQQANSGHPGMPMGMADAATALWTRALRFDPQAPDWPDRDRFVLSAGHGSMLLYALLHLSGSPHVSLADIRDFRQHRSRTPGHPEYGHTPGVETTTGPLGQGLGAAVGMAMAERRLNTRFGDDLVDHRTWVIAGDGCLMEGIAQESISLAGRLRLSRLAVLWDDNAISIDGPVSLTESGDQLARFRAAGWAVRPVDGHDFAAVVRALAWARRQDRPSLVACRTRIGKGAATLEGHHDTHGKALGAVEIGATRERLGWTHGPFEVPPEVADAWRRATGGGAAARRRWEARLAAHPERAEFERVLAGDVPAPALEALDALAAAPAAADATRVHSGAALAAVAPFMPELVGGSADLTGSVNTLVKGMADFDAPDYAGQYVRYGIREHAMAAAMNGMALHGGVVPYGGTFLVFSDYMRPSIRMAALQGVRVVHIGTHDSIGVGEDGPTHQPVEHLASLRAMPNLEVFRPCDRVETAECWALALGARTTPSLFALSRQKTPVIRAPGGGPNLSAKGAYTLPAPEPAGTGAGAAARAVIFATGTEVALAVAAQAALAAEGVGVRVVSVPAFRRFFAQPEDYRREVLGDEPVRLAVEAGVRQGWDPFIGADGVFIGMEGFGASAPGPALFEAFGITAEAVAAAIRGRL